jgi:hypothetical protein
MVADHKCSATQYDYHFLWPPDSRLAQAGPVATKKFKSLPSFRRYQHCLNDETQGLVWNYTARTSSQGWTDVHQR